MSTYTLHFDGSCGPKNPGGTAAYGFVLSKDGQEVGHDNGIIGTGEGMTNNLAEFHALWRGLLSFHTHSQIYIGTDQRFTLHVFGDSNLVVQMMNNKWRAKSDKAYFEDYKIAEHTVTELRKAGATITFTWIPRENNTICDDLSKAHLQK